MKKLSVILLSLSLLAPIIILAPDTRAEHTRNIFWCEVKSELNVVDLGIFIGDTGTEKLQIIHNPAKISTNQGDIGGTAAIVNINTSASREIGLQSISPTISIESNVRKICGKVGGPTTSSVPAIAETSRCTTTAKDDFNNDSIRDGLNIQFLGMISDGAEVIGILTGGIISNLEGRVSSSLFGRVFNALIGEYSYSPVSTTQSSRETIAHNASRVCILNASGSTTPVSGTTPPSGSATGGGVPGATPGGGGAVGSSGGVKDSCTIGKKIELKGETFNEGDIVGPGTTDQWGTVCLINTINNTDWIFFILMAVSFIMILLAGFMWVTSGTNPENQKKAGRMIIAALVGIAIALLARIIPAIIIGILT